MSVDQGGMPLTSAEGSSEAVVARVNDPAQGWRAAASALLVPIVTVVALVLLSPSYALATTMIIYAGAAVACGFLLGTAGMLSFGQGVPFGVGAYASGLAMIHWHVQVPAAIGIGVAAGTIIALFVGALSILGKGVSFVMLTFAFAAMFGYLVYVFKDFTGGENGLRGLPPATVGVAGQPWLTVGDNASRYILAAVVFVLIYGVTWLVNHSPLGAVLAAVRESEVRARAIGYNTYFAKVAAFTVAGGLTGAAGALYTVFLGSAPDTSIQVDMSSTILIMAILGGVASPFGPVLGAITYFGVSSFMSPYLERWQIVLALALLVVVLFWRGGIYGALASLARALNEGQRTFRWRRNGGRDEKAK